MRTIDVVTWPASIWLLLAMLLPLRGEESLVPDRDAEGRLRVRMICGSPATAERLRRLTEHPELQSLSLAGDELTDSGLAPLRQLRRLEVVELTSRQLTARGIAQLEGLPNLRTVRLAQFPISREVAARFAGLPQLESLSLRQQAIEPDAWSELSRLPRLRELRIVARDWSETDVLGLRGFSRLHRLGLAGAPVTIPLLQAAVGNSELEELGLGEIALTSEVGVALQPFRRLARFSCRPRSLALGDLGAFAELPLRSLELYGDVVDDRDCSELERLTRLEWLYVPSERVSEAATRRLRAALPDTVVNLFRWGYSTDELRAMCQSLQVDDRGRVVMMAFDHRRPATDEKLRLVAAQSGLSRLALVGPIGDQPSPRLTDEGLRRLEQLDTLKELVVDAASVSDLGLEALRRALRGCRID